MAAAGMHGVAVSIDGLATNARSRARHARQLRLGAGRARAPRRRRARHHLQHRRQSPEHRRARAALRDVEGRRRARLAGAAHRRARTRRRSAGAARAAVAALDAGPAHRAAQGARLRRRHPALARQQPRLLRPRREAAALAQPDGQRSLGRLLGGPLRPGHRVRRRRQGLPVTADAPLRRRATCATSRCATSGSTRPSWPSRGAAPSTICGASAAPAPSPTTASAAATSPPTRSSAAPGNNPYCHYRAKTLADRGLRERLVLREAAPGEPFDHGRFAIVEEPFDAPDPSPPRREQRLRVWRE